MKRVYVDGVFDLFHRGHLESLRKAKHSLDDPENTFLIVGIVSDKDCESYKRTPIISEDDRVEIIKNIKFVDEIVFPCPMTMTLEFVEKNNIDLVVHGFSKNGQLAKDLVKHGFYLSFGKGLFNPSMDSVFSKIPLDKIFLETDDADCSIEDIYKKAAQIKNTSIEQLSLQIMQNSKTVFKTNFY
jgi:cytidyltransferase-like protein